VKDAAAYFYPGLYPVFPVTVNDAAGSAVSVPARPETVLYTFEPDAALLALFESLDGIAVMPATARIALEAVDVMFYAADDPDTVPAGLPADSVVIALHAGDTPAAALADLLLVGTALGERTAALEAAARYSDTVEASAN
jgi:ABC-type Fe3+-hydroxamate transport system substrate-binding protein